MSLQKGKPEITKRFVSKGIFPYQYAFTLLIPLRNIFLSPKQLINRLELTDRMNVLEVGPGPGYYSPAIAKILTNGKLVLADIQKEMLDFSKKRLEKKGITNVEYYLCDGSTFHFRDETFDRIFLVSVLGEVGNKENYLHEFYRILKYDGILSISELPGDPDRLTIEEVKTLTGKHGFEFYKLYGSKRNYTINFKKK